MPTIIKEEKKDTIQEKVVKVILTILTLILIVVIPIWIGPDSLPDNYPIHLSKVTLFFEWIFGVLLIMALLVIGVISYIIFSHIYEMWSDIINDYEK